MRADQGGELLVCLYDDPETWLKPERALRVVRAAPEGETVIVRLGDLPPGRYALQVIHDKNLNGKFDMRTFPWPKPKEGGGISHNNFRMGPPRWEPALFTVGAGELVRLDVALRY